MTRASRSPLWRHLVPLIAVAPLVTSCWPLTKTYEWDQKLTVELLVDGALKSGSAISHVSWSAEPNLFGNYDTSVKGDAAYVEIKDGVYIFAIVDEQLTYIAQDTFERYFHIDRKRYKEINSKISVHVGEADVPRNRYPRMVTFSNLKDPSTLRPVTVDNISNIFGNSVSLVRIKLQINPGADAKHDIATLLPWLDWSHDQFFAHGGGTSPLRYKSGAPTIVLDRTNFRQR